MTVQEILALMQIVSTVLDQVTKLIDALKASGVDVSGIKLHTSTPIDLGALFHLGQS